MKPCPSCCYGNPDTGVKCAICGGDISRVAVKTERPPEKESWTLIGVGLLLICCGAVFFFTQRPTGKDQVPKTVGSGLSDEAAFDYGGVLSSLSELERLRFLPREEKTRVAALAASQDDRVGHAAVKLLGKWARGDDEPADRRAWFETLLKSAASGHAAVRRQAAFEAGASAAEGFPFKSYLPEIKKISAALISETDERLQASGFFLAAMAGLDEFADEMRRVFALYPSGVPKIYASCALARLGDEEGLKYLLEASSRPGGELRPEAESCLGYAAAVGMPPPERLPLFPKTAGSGQKRR